MPIATGTRYLSASALQSSTTLVINIDAEVVGTLNDDILLGSARSDRMFGGDGWDVISGLDDDDILYGNAGLDTLDGGDDDDILYGGKDDDLLRGGDGDDALFGGLNSDPAYVLRDGVVVLLDGRDTLSGGAGNDLIYGNQGDDLIDGGGDDDILYGGQGADRLTGGEGDDTLFGGQGGDVFVYRNVDDDRDVIQDFDVTADRILLANGVSISISYSTGDDTELRLSTGTRITLIGVTDPDDVAIAWG